MLDASATPPETPDTVELLVPSMTCAGCMRKVETTLAALPGVAGARANLTRHRVSARIDPASCDEDALIAALAGAGYAARPLDQAIDAAGDDPAGRAMLLRIGVAGFAAMNVMLLSVSVWSGADGATRDLLHWISALIALPAIGYAGLPFVTSAAGALRAGRVNMDVPITLAIGLAIVMSAIEVSRGGAHAYFDAAIMLIFFLLTGRYLEHRSRIAARSAAAELAQIAGRHATEIAPDGTQRTIPVTAIRPGMTLRIAPGDRIPAEGLVVHGASALDRAILTGESDPVAVEEGGAVDAGVLNLSGALDIRVTAAGEDTLLGEIARLVDTAERGRGRYERLADRWARHYVAIVHALAAIAFAGWYWASGDLLTALSAATAILIITCPCALALAIPTVQTAVAGRLFRSGIYLKDGAELERLAEVDLVAFDKTGTLTVDRPILTRAPDVDDFAWPVAAALAGASRHPFSQAIAAEAEALGIVPATMTGIVEHPGLGIEGTCEGRLWRLGRAGAGREVELSDGFESRLFGFEETLRAGAAEAVGALRARGLRLAILSGDAPGRVWQVARRLGIGDWSGGLMPQEKLTWLGDRRAEGSRVLMVGDGLNDGPALAAAHAAISHGTASDVAKNAAGIVFTGGDLRAIPFAIAMAHHARRRAHQSLGLAVTYNAFAIPLALAGLVTPMIAAIAMSGSSILVVLNAVRPGGGPAPEHGP